MGLENRIFIDSQWGRGSQRQLEGREEGLRMESIKRRSWDLRKRLMLTIWAILLPLMLSQAPWRKALVLFSFHHESQSFGFETLFSQSTLWVSSPNASSALRTAACLLGHPFTQPGLCFSISWFFQPDHSALIGLILRFRATPVVQTPFWSATGL